MKTSMLKIVLVSILSSLSFLSLAQSPTVGNTTVTSITSTGATLGGEVTTGAPLNERGTRWHTSSPVGSNNEQAEGGTTASVFSHSRPGMPSGTEIFFVAYATNGSGTSESSESSFFTLSTEPTTHPASFTATPNGVSGTTEITLNFSAASSIAEADGYILLRRNDGIFPDATNINDGIAPGSLTLPAGTTLVTTITNPATTSILNTGRTPGTLYTYTIIPYNSNGSDDETYNYLTSGSIRTAAVATYSAVPDNHPVSFSATSGGSDQINLSFSAASSITNAVGYIVLRREDGTDPTTTDITDGVAPGALIPPAGTTLVTAITNTSTAGFNDTGLQDGTRYRYAIIPYNYNGVDNGTYNYRTSATIQTDNAFTYSTVPDAHPASFEANALSATEIELSFSAASSIGNADGYIILRRQDGSAPTIANVTDGTAPGSLSLPAGTTLVTTITSTATTSFTNTGRTSGQEYIYAIIPYNYNGTNNSTYNYRTSGSILTATETPGAGGVTIVSATATAACTGSYTTLSNIQIRETTTADFSTSGSLILELDNPAFSFQVGQGSVTQSSCCNSDDDITSISITINASRITVNYTLDGAQNRKDTIIISGIRVLYDGTSPPETANLRKTGGTATQNGNAIGVHNFGIINNGTAPAIPSAPIFSSGTGEYCVASNISTITADVTGSSIRWYSDASLTTQVASGNTVNIETDLGISTASAGTFTRYVTQTSGCESPTRIVNIVINPLPVADAGADLTGVNAVCPNQSITLGGSPTVSTPTTGPYSYSWNDPDPSPGAPSAISNPSVSPSNATGSNQNYSYIVTIQDAKGCTSEVTALSTKEVEVKTISENVTITQPSQFSFTSNDDPVTLQGLPAGGIFSGIGVTQLNGSYRFDPKAVGTTGSPYAVTYTVTLANGCTKSIVQNFFVSAASVLYESIDPRYCNDENPVSVILTAATINNIINYINNWNSTYVPLFGYAPLKAVPVPSPSTPLPVSIRNYYEGYYGIKNAILAPGGTYTRGGHYISNYSFDPRVFITDEPSYPTNPTLNYAYVGIFIEFQDPNNTYPYNIAANTDNGSTYHNGTQAGFMWRGQGIQINSVPRTFFTGLKSGLVNDNQFCEDLTNGVFYELTGSQQTISSEFRINDGTGFKNDPGTSDGIETLPGGIGRFYPGVFSGASPRNYTVRYTVSPGTLGSASRGECSRSQDQAITIYPLDAISYASPTPAGGTDFCFEGNPVTLRTNKGVGPTTGISYSGFGVSNGGNGEGLFTPKAGFEQTDPISPIELDVTVRATYTSPQGCISNVDRTFTIYPKPVSNYIVPGNDTLFCYNDSQVSLQGSGQPSNSKFTFEYIGLTPNGTLLNNQVPFNPKSYYDSATERGLSNLSEAKLNIRYTVNDAIGCTATSSKLFTIAPEIPVSIFGVNDGDVYCANEPSRVLTFSPQPEPGNGRLFIDNVEQSINASTRSYTLIKPNGGEFELRYEYRSGSGLLTCPNVDTDIVRLIPSPKAQFSTTPQCDGVEIAYTAAPDPDNAEWSWTIVNDVLSGSAVQYTFPGLSQNASSTTYPVALLVKSSPDGTTGIVCRDSLIVDQIIGAYPKIDFNYSDVCENDFTQFTIQAPGVPIVSAQWNFDDGHTLPNKPINQNIDASDNSSGTFLGKYGTPEHKFPIVSGQPNRYQVELTGRTAPSLGGCQATVTHQVAILQNVIASPESIYDMTQLNGGDGLWVEEDRAGNTTWEFATAFSNKQTITAPPGGAWITNASGTYNANDKSYVNSPCLDISSFSRPVISLEYWNNTDLSKDGTVLQYSLNGGSTWHVLGTRTSGLNWFNELGIASQPGEQNQLGWSGKNQNQWLSGKHSLDGIPVIARNKIRLRIAFASDDLDQLDGFSFSNVKIEERNRLMLFENFTNIGDNSQNNTRFGSISANEVVKLEYHSSFPAASDNINAANPADHNARIAFYGITTSNIPRGYIDGVSHGSFVTNWYADFAGLRSLAASSYAISVESLPGNNNQIVVKASIRAINDIPVSNHNLLIAIVEKRDNEVNILRRFLPSATGTAIPLPMNRDAIFEQTLQWEVNTPVDPTALAVIVFIQDEDTKEILQTSYLENPTNLPSVITSAEANISKQTHVYPNPGDHEITVVLDSPIRKKTWCKMVDVLGNSVDEQILTPGKRSYTIRTKEFAAGIYVIELDTDKGLVRKTISIVHNQ
jgi:hypothetical protein